MDSIMTLISSVTIDKPWGIDIPNYFWLAGSSVATYLIANFALVFGWKKYRPIAGISLLLSLLFILVAPLNLVDDLEQPGRILNFFSYGWENFFTSPMKWGVLLLASYIIIIIIEILFLFRPYFAKKVKNSNGIEKKFYHILTLGNIDLGEDSFKKDKKRYFIAGAIGMFLAVGVEEYTGYIIGAVHANVMWHSSVMPLLFLASSMVSGIGMLILMVAIFQKFFTNQKRIDKKIILTLTNILAWAIVIDLIMRFFWLTFSILFGDNGRYGLYEYFQLDFQRTLWIDYILCLFVPMIIGFTKLKNIPLFSYIAGLVAAVGVWIFRWNIVIGGQEIPRTTPGFLHYTPPMFGQDSIVSVLSNWGILFALICVVLLIIPLDEEMEDCYKGVENAK